jgi:DNA-binding phage protein
MKILEVDDVIQLLRTEVDRAGGQAAWAEKTGIDRTFLNSVINGRRSVSRRIIEALNLRIVFVPGQSAVRAKASLARKIRLTDY